MRYVPDPCLINWPWFTQLVTGPLKDRTIVCDIMNAIGSDDQHILRFRAFEQLDTLEYLGFTTVLSELDTRVPLEPESKAIVSQVIDFCVPLMQGIRNRPSRRDLVIDDGPYAVLSPASVTEQLKRYDRLPMDDFRPLYESSPALKEWTAQWKAEAPQIAFEDFEIHCEAWAELLDLAARRNWGVFCLI